MKKGKRSPLKKKGYFKQIALAVCGIIIVIAIIGSRSTSKPAGSKLSTGQATQSVDPIRIILGKSSRNPVQSRFDPVLIFRLDRGERDAGHFAGSGSRFMGKSGEQIVTSEHLFSHGSGEQMYAYQPLRSGNNMVYGIEKVMNTGKEIGGGTGMADVILLKTGDAKPILGFSVHTLKTTTVSTMLTSFTKAPFLRSLVTGEEVRMLGKTTDPLGVNVDYMLIDYPSIDGESGTGFVDKDDNIYVLKGQPVDYSPKDFSIFGKFKGIALAYGPLKFTR
jgi:hypothetical protein